MTDHIVTEKDWFRSGFNDAKHGNPAWPPAGCAISRKAYREGYASGKRGNEHVNAVIRPILDAFKQ